MRYVKRNIKSPTWVRFATRRRNSLNAVPLSPPKANLFAALLDRQHWREDDRLSVGGISSFSLGFQCKLDQAPNCFRARGLVTLRLAQASISDLSAGASRTADRFHRNETGSLHLRQGARKVRLRSPCHLHQFRYGLRLAITDEREKLAGWPSAVM